MGSTSPPPPTLKRSSTERYSEGVTHSKASTRARSTPNSPLRHSSTRKTAVDPSAPRPARAPSSAPSSPPSHETPHPAASPSASTPRSLAPIQRSYPTRQAILTIRLEQHQSQSRQTPTSSRSMGEMNQILEVLIQTLHGPKWKEDEWMVQETVIEENMGISQSSLPGGHLQEVMLVERRSEEDDQYTVMRSQGPFHLRGKLEVKTTNFKHDWMEGCGIG
ncbi:hypothetical protein BDM02DRAFT_3132827 [Thelephora ganbajun]|uniref:Uncharacterized protein n=1 Tax=Thelephora ganbajun TaxID=370292 RepID=A0ACB6Z061_THEGA|nr:hypothetical protein BDM02DRAFT_3132827 [Thelephora ganbajun]